MHFPDDKSAPCEIDGNKFYNGCANGNTAVNKMRKREPEAGMLHYEQCKGRRTQVAKGEVCKTSIRRFESARRLSFFSARHYLPRITE